ncbi:calpain-C isoform X1 [Manduca sexta]|uniref:calpain-C isoform X1 n=1 Tax=Manduca sexta TaxID=7130 RepID=UPI00188FE947|nr:calpain-C isoform X1 [Manduca sexta]
MSDYEKIRTSCLQREVLWEDPDFPANQTSVFYYQTPPFHFVWKRASEIYTNPSFVLDKCDTFDVVPGKLGDKWFVSCLGVLYLCKGLFYRVVPADQRMDTSYAGIFRFRLWWCGQWVEVLVDDRLPTVNGKLAFLQTSHTDQLWPALLEKAYAKLHGSYEALKYGSLLDGLADLTGGITESIVVSELPNPEVLKTLLSCTSVVTAHHLPLQAEDRNIPGLELEMNYRITDIQQVHTTDKPVYLLRLRRPPTPGETRVSHIVVDQALWKTVLQYERDRLLNTTKGFWMMYEDFLRLFPRIDMVHLDAETSRAEPSLADITKWHMKTHHGAWKRGVSAGGCRNYFMAMRHYIYEPVDFFHTNPQIQIILTEPDTVIISLNQHSIMEPKVIGFSVYKMPKFLTETAPQLFFRRIKSTINSQYTNSRQVSQRCDLDSGAYLILPTTFEPREVASFTLKIYSGKTLKMKVLDDPPQMTKAALIRAPAGSEGNGFFQYESLFLQLADEHRTIDVFELQELLDACLPNDYIKSCVSIDTCRQIVLAMDRKGTGRISLTDFKDLICSLKHLQQVFKDHAREKMGVLRVERLRDALRDVGFVVPERAMTLLVFRYMRKDGMLRFGDFVSAVMHLHRVFELFYMNDARRSDILQLNLTDWLKNALMC